MNKPKKFITGMLSQAGVVINGQNSWDISINDDRFYARVLREKHLGLGESYMDGWWNCERIDEFISRILMSRLDVKIKGSIKYFLHFLPDIFLNLQSKSRARIIAEHHYDSDNELFMSFLDPYNQYSCAYFNNTADLNQAQQNKLDLICKKLALCSNDHVLDIGSGWGGFAKYAAEHYGCTITAVNISKEQNQYASNFCKNLPILILDCDYRGILGTFNKIVSVGMFEHVGQKNYRTFMTMVHNRLKDGGIFLLHTIGSNETRRNNDLWTKKYIFPNSMLPSMAQICKSIEGLFIVEDLHNLCPHYAKTLLAWNENFQRAWPRLGKKYDKRFKRMWEYYLLSYAGAFRSRSNQVWQVVLTKYGNTQPACRI